MNQLKKVAIYVESDSVGSETNMQGDLVASKSSSLGFVMSCNHASLQVRVVL